jgi:hypothetical protein
MRLCERSCDDKNCNRKHLMGSDLPDGERSDSSYSIFFYILFREIRTSFARFSIAKQQFEELELEFI